jgi:predicted DCC family thiol-disulfide oxidoreductase YuxK
MALVRGNQPSMNTDMNTSSVVVYFDGLCPLCSREIEHYRHRTRDGQVQYVDITAPGFDPQAEGLDADRIHRVLHVKENGQVRTGVDAFVAIWQAVPGYAWLARLARWPIVRPLLSVGYHAFAAVRPLLPRRKRAECESGTCQR